MPGKQEAGLSVGAIVADKLSEWIRNKFFVVVVVIAAHISKPVILAIYISREKQKKIEKLKYQLIWQTPAVEIMFNQLCFGQGLLGVFFFFALFPTKLFTNLKPRNLTIYNS